MKKLCALLFLLPIIAFSAQWESFPLRENGTISVWTVVGPLPNGMAREHDQNCFGYFKDYLIEMGGESQAQPKEMEMIEVENGDTVTWENAFSEKSGLLDFVDIFEVEKESPGVAYAFCQLISPIEQKVILKIRSNDGVRVWLNQQMVHDHHVGRTIDSQEDRIAVLLKKGVNPLLAKVDQGGGAWGLAVKVSGENGLPAKEVSSSIHTLEPIKNLVSEVRITPTPIIKNTQQGERQLVYAEIVSGGLSNVTCSIAKEEWQKPQEIFIKTVPAGNHKVELAVPVITKTEQAKVTLTSLDKILDEQNIVLPKADKWTVYLVQHVHTDIGYTRPQTEILPEHLRFIDTALDYCDKTDHYPDDARFRWTCEVTWPVREYLNRRPPQQKQRLLKRIKEGRIEIAGMFLNMSELATESALAASLQPIKQLKQEGFPVQTVMQNDVNGIGWCLVDYFSDIGIKYLTMGINKTRSVLPFDRPTPFWWESPSGKRLLSFRADHYHVANYWKLHEANFDMFEPGLLDYLANLKKIDYPFNQIAIQFSGYNTDNSPPSTRACDLVKEWNERYVWPRLRIATAQEYMAYVEENHADELPVYRAAWPDWWTDGFGSAARETAKARKTHNALQVSESLLSMASVLGAEMSPGAGLRAAAVNDALLFYDEHTFGAAESISDPMAENSMEQWGEKSSYVWEAVKKQGLVREEALGLLQDYAPASEIPMVMVFNTMSWARSGLLEIFIDHELLPVDSEFQILDKQTQKPVKVQPIKSRSEGTYWALWADDIPAMGFRTFEIIVKGKNQGIPLQNSLNGDVLENTFYKMEIDPLTGSITSLYDKELKQELVDQQSSWDLGQFIYERITQGRDFNPDRFKRTTLRNIEMQAGSTGPIWKSIVLSADADGCEEGKGLTIEFKLFETEKKLEMAFQMRKERKENAEACYVALPFQLEGGKIIYEAQGGLVTPGKNQIPGSSSDWNTVQNFTTIRNESSQIVTASQQVPLVQFGEINLGKWQYIAHVEKPHIYSWIMNNYWFTNFRAFQEGEFKWHYSITSTSDTSNTAATRFGWSACNPLVSRVIASSKEGSGDPTLSALQFDASNVLLVNAKPVENGILLHLREVEGKTASLSLKNNIVPNNLSAVDEVNVLNETLHKDVSTISFKPFEVKFVKFELIKE
jgi:alpha-mannosidase